MYKSQCMINTFLQVKYLSVPFQEINCFDQTKLIQEGEKAMALPLFLQWKDQNRYPLLYKSIEFIHVKLNFIFIQT